mgnify:CR=1 FL=1
MNVGVEGEDGEFGVVGGAPGAQWPNRMRAAGACAPSTGVSDSVPWPTHCAPGGKPEGAGAGGHMALTSPALGAKGGPPMCAV